MLNRHSDHEPAYVESHSRAYSSSCPYRTILSSRHRLLEERDSTSDISSCSFNEGMRGRICDANSAANAVSGPIRTSTVLIGMALNLKQLSLKLASGRNTDATSYTLSRSIGTSAVLVGTALNLRGAGFDLVDRRSNTDASVSAVTRSRRAGTVTIGVADELRRLTSET